MSTDPKLYAGLGLIVLGVVARLFMPDAPIDAAWTAITIGGTLAGVAVPTRRRNKP